MGGIFEFQIHFLFLYPTAQAERPVVSLCNGACAVDAAHLHLINIDHSFLPCDSTAGLNKYLSVFLLKHVL